MKKIGKQIQQLRTQLGMSLENLSDRTKIDIETLEKIESGSFTVELETTKGHCRGFGC